MSARISSLPVVVSANIVDTDILPIVTGIATNTSVTKRVSVSELRLKLGTTPPAGGRTVTSISTYLDNNAVFNVRDFGAFGDGVTDDATAIQNALNTASTSGGVVYFPPGTYKITVGMVGKINVQLRGSGIGATTILYTGAAEGYVATGTGSQNWYAGLFDLTLKTNGTVPAYPGTYGIKLVDVGDFWIERVQLTRWGSAGVLLSGTVNCTNITIAECDIHENQGGVYMSGGNAIVNHIVIRDSKVRASEAWNIFVPQDVRNWTIIGNDLEAGKTGGLWFLSGLGLSITSNYFEQVTAAPAIVISDSLTYEGVVIMGNNISGTGVANGASAIKLGTTGAIYGLVLTGNAISNWQVAVDSNGVQSGVIGPNWFSSVGTKYKYSVTQATSQGLITHDDTGLRGAGGGISADVGNAAYTVVHGTNPQIILYNTPITANRAVTINITNAQHGDRVRVVRTAAATGAFTVDVGAGPLKSLAAGQWCEVTYDGQTTQTWKLIGFGNL